MEKNPILFLRNEKKRIEMLCKFLWRRSPFGSVSQKSEVHQRAPTRYKNTHNTKQQHTTQSNNTKQQLQATTQSNNTKQQHTTTHPHKTTTHNNTKQQHTTQSNNTKHQQQNQQQHTTTPTTTQHTQTQSNNTQHKATTQSTNNRQQHTKTHNNTKHQLQATTHNNTQQHNNNTVATRVAIDRCGPGHVSAPLSPTGTQEGQDRGRGSREDLHGDDADASSFPARLAQCALRWMLMRKCLPPAPVQTGSLPCLLRKSGFRSTLWSTSSNSVPGLPILNAPVPQVSERRRWKRALSPQAPVWFRLEPAAGVHTGSCLVGACTTAHCESRQCVPRSLVGLSYAELRSLRRPHLARC